MNDTPKTGYLLFAHGARDPNWALPFEAVAARLRAQRPGAGVHVAFLEFMTPDLGSAADALVAEGCTRIDVVPLFLGAGGHVRKDVPPLLDAVRARHPGVTVHLHRAVGERDELVAAMAQAAIALADGA
jgi:sirohydrochlorin cobaltochelatase